MDAAARLGYRPNLMARSLITRRSKIIGVAVGYLFNPFYPALLNQLSHKLEAMGYRVLLFVSNPGESSDPILEEVLCYRLDAVILVAADLSSHFDEECRQAGVPVVLINRKTESTTISNVTCANAEGAEAIARFLIAGDHRRFAYVAGIANSSTNRDRETAFNQYLTAQGFDPPMRVAGNYTFDDAAQAARDLLNLSVRPDAIFCCNDFMALAVINVARCEFGLNIGGDISIVGFDNISPSDWPTFALTTYEQPMEKMVDQAIEILQQRLEEAESICTQHVLPGTLVVRGSARIPPTGVTEVDGRLVWTDDVTT